MQKNVLVTGAAGFIGSALAQRLIDQNFIVHTIDNLSTGKEERIPQGVVFHKGDVQDEKLIQSLNKVSFDTIYHVAGQSSGEVSFENPVYDLQTNTQSTLLLLELSRKTSCKKFVFASTMSVYGDQEALPVNESAQPFAKSFYGVGKLASENYLDIYTKTYGIHTAVLRLFNVYGPGQNLDNLKQGMVSIFLAQAINSGKIHVKGSANRFRDFIYIEDVVEAFLRSSKYLDEKQQLLCNVCTGVKTTVGEVVQSIKDAFDGEIPTSFEGSTPGDQHGIYGDTSNFVKELGDWPLVPFEEGMRKFVNAIVKT